MEEWVTISEAAAWAQTEFANAHRTVSRKTVSRWAQEGKIRAEQRGNRWYVDAVSLRGHVTLLLSVAHHETAPAQSAENPELRYLLDLRRFAAERNARFLRDLEAGID